MSFLAEACREKATQVMRVILLIFLLGDLGFKVLGATVPGFPVAEAKDLTVQATTLLTPQDFGRISFLLGVSQGNLSEGQAWSGLIKDPTSQLTSTSLKRYHQRDHKHMSDCCHCIIDQ